MGFGFISLDLSGDKDDWGKFSVLVLGVGVGGVVFSILPSLKLTILISCLYYIKNEIFFQKSIGNL